jgi:hypothetical protein
LPFAGKPPPTISRTPRSIRAWTLARGKRAAENPTALEAKYRDIQDQATWTGKATKTAGTVAGDFIARVLGWVALILMLAGLVLGVAARLSDAYWPQALCTRTDCI